MLRLIHTQKVQGSIILDDIDDGLPNKAVHRLGSTGDPKAYDRDGYANSPKQRCYIPRRKLTDPTVAGYIDLKQTERVTLSAGKGKIKKFQDAGLILVVAFVEADLATPVISPGGAQLGVPGVGDVTLTGTSFLSLGPDTSYVLVTGTGGPLILSRSAIVTSGGTFTDMSVVILAALIPGVVATTTFVKVLADDKLSNALALV
jgi:hypothetical protein